VCVCLEPYTQGAPVPCDVQQQCVEQLKLGHDLRESGRPARL
jgi:hypothetical protein